MKKTKTFWNLLAHHYDAQVSKKYRDAYNKTVELTKPYLKPDHVILDFACGTGITTLELSQHVKKICAIDIADKMIHVAQQKSMNQNIKNIDFKVADLSDMEKTEQKFDVVLAYNILYLSKNIKTVLHQIHTLLVPSGVFLSATDCFGEQKDYKVLASSLLSKLGALPEMTRFTAKGLEKIIADHGFKILEVQNVHDGLPPNYFIAAEKK